MRVWDLLFLKGSKELFRISLAVFDLLKDELLAAQEFSEVIFVLETKVRNLDEPLRLLAKL